MDATSDAPRSPSEAPTDDAAGRGGSPAGSGPVRIVCWSASGVAESADLDGLAGLVAQPDTRLWVDLTDPTEQTVRSVARTLQLHPLVADDIEERNERAKVAVYDDLVHVVLFDVEYRGEVQPTELDLVLGKQFLLSVHGSATDLARRVTMRDGVGAVLAKGTDFLLYTITDRIVDGYFPMMDKLADEIDDLQDQVVESPNEWTLQKVFTMKKELLAIRRATSPARKCSTS